MQRCGSPSPHHSSCPNWGLVGFCISVRILSEIVLYTSGNIRVIITHINQNFEKITIKFPYRTERRQIPSFKALFWRFQYPRGIIRHESSHSLKHSSIKIKPFFLTFDRIVSNKMQYKGIGNSSKQPKGGKKCLAQEIINDKMYPNISKYCQHYFICLCSIYDGNRIQKSYGDPIKIFNVILSPFLWLGDGCLGRACVKEQPL